MDVFFSGVILTATGSFFLEAFVLSSVFLTFDFALLLSFSFVFSFVAFVSFPFFGDGSVFFGVVTVFFIFFGG